MYCDFCKNIGLYCVPICQLHNFHCAVFKVKLNFAPLAVAVCLILVDYGGDFLFYPLHRFPFEPVLGSLSQERYQKMLEGYEAEQAALNNEIIGLEDWVATREEMEDNVDQFLALMEKYVDIPELTTTIVNEFVKQIIVYAPGNVKCYAQKGLQVLA